MSNLAAYVPLTGTVHAALDCVTDTTGRTVCTGASSGLFATLGVTLFIYLAILVLGILAAVKVATKAGYSGWWVLITFIPLVGAVFVFIFAFSTWPVTKEVQMLRAQLAGTRGYGGRGAVPTGGPGPRGPIPGRPGSTNPVPTTPETSPGEQTTLPTFGEFITEGKMPTEALSDRSAGSAPPLTEAPPAGWYPAPEGAPGQLRYWDGSTWTDQVRSS
jgi:Protein of unknown function (DUF2510)